MRPWRRLAIGVVAPGSATDTATARRLMGTIHPQSTRQPQFTRHPQSTCNPRLMCIHPVSTPIPTTSLAPGVIGRLLYVLISAVTASVS